jgi:peptide/nickel transport system substrate-binding protein
MKRVWVFAGLLVLVVTLSAPALGQQPATSKACPVTGGTLRFGLSRDAVGLDPHINFGVTSSSVQGNVYDNLVDYDVKGQISPSLAESWTQPDPTTYVFKLRRSAKFHDGTPFGAADVLYSFQRISNPETKATRFRDFAAVQSVRALDPYTVEVRLKQPSATFLNLLASRETYMVSKKWAEAGGDFRKAANGTAPFKLASYEPSVRYTLERHPGAWNPPCVDRVEMLPAPDDRARVNAFKSGQTDLVEYLPWQDVEFFFRERGFRVYRGFDLFNMVRLNVNRPPLNNPKVRQALNFLVNRQTVAIIAFGGQGQPMDGFLMRRDSWAYDPQTSKVWKYDPQRAMQLLREAGINQPSDLRLVFDSATISVHFDTAQVILQALRSAGITVEFRPMDIPTLFQKRTTGDYMMMMDGLSLPWADPDAYYQYFHSAGTAHAAAIKFRNARLDALLEEGRRLTDQTKRKAIYADVERILAEEAPWLFTLWRPQAEASRSFVKGYTRLPGGLGTSTVAYFERIYIEK